MTQQLDQTPLISIVVIFLDAEKYLAEAIESVLAQTYERWELLLVDDGSSDGSSETAGEYARRWPEKIRYLEHPGHENLGMSAARNLGIREARGELVALLDADDRWLPRKLEEAQSILKAHPEAAMIFGRPRVWYDWKEGNDGISHDHLRPLGIIPNRLIDPPALLSPLLTEEINGPIPSSVLMRRETIERVGGFEEEFRSFYEDYVLFAKIFLEAPVYVASQSWELYRQHPESSSQRGMDDGRILDARIRFLDFVAAYCRRKGGVDAALEDVLEGKSLSRSDRRARWRVDAAREVVEVGWQLEPAGRVEIRVDAPNGQLFYQSVCDGQKTTGRWVRDGMVFYLLDAANNSAPEGERVMAKADVILTRDHLIMRDGAFSVSPGAADTLAWQTSGCDAVEIRFGAPDGPRLGSGGAVGKIKTTEWQRVGASVYLQDVSDGVPRSAENTLAVARMVGTDEDLRLRTGGLRLSRVREPWRTLLAQLQNSLRERYYTFRSGKLTRP